MFTKHWVGRDVGTFVAIPERFGCRRPDSKRQYHKWLIVRRETNHMTPKHSLEAVFCGAQFMVTAAFQAGAGALVTNNDSVFFPDGCLTGCGETDSGHYDDASPSGDIRFNF